MLAVNPFSAKRKTIQRTKIWETVLQYLEEIEEPPFKVTVRVVQDRYTLLSKKFRKRTASEQKASGISPKMSELDILLEELTGVDQSEEDRLSESEEKNQTTEQDRAKAVDMRKKAMENLSEATRRKSREENQPKKKARRPISDSIEYLKQRNDAEFALWREELQIKKKEKDEKSKKNEEAAKRQEEMMKMMAQQNQNMLQLISKLITK